MKRKKRFNVFILLFLVGVIISGCNSYEVQPNRNDSDLTIYTTIYPIQYIIEQIGGDTVSVKTVYPPGVDAHTYEPTSKDMTAIATSDAFFYFGAGMEGFAETAANALTSESVKLIELSENKELFHGADDHHHGDEAYGDGEETNNHNNEGNDHEDETLDHVEEAHGQDEGIHDHDNETFTHHDGNEDIIVEGLLKHYHSGDQVKLTATYLKDDQYDNWNWFTMHPDETEWKMVPNQESNQYLGEATIDGQKIKAVLYDNDHNDIAESEILVVGIDDHEGYNDPHVWIDPLRMIEMAKIIKNELIDLHSQSEDLYHKNFESLEENLQKLDDKFVEVLDKKENKYMIVPHAAYGYWKERYGIEQIAISGLSTTDEPSQKYLTEVIQKAKEYDLDYVLYEQNTPDKLMEIIQEQIEAEALIIHNISVLTEDDIKSNEDYISLMNYNLDILDKILK